MTLTDRRYEAVLFDFFGTLVDYQPDRGRLKYPATHRLLRSWGYDRPHDAFVADWDAASATLEAHSAATFQEFSMLDAAQAISTTSGLGLSPDRCQQLAGAFLTEWQTHICPIVGVADLIVRLSATFRLGILSNTHDPDMVPSMLQTMGVADRFAVIVLSVDHGYRKPHPSIYRAALDRMGAQHDTTVFVGDSYDSDYLGPKRAGMAAYLIDPRSRHDLAPGARTHQLGPRCRGPTDGTDTDNRPTRRRWVSSTTKSS